MMYIFIDNDPHVKQDNPVYPDVEFPIFFRFYIVLYDIILY